VTTSVEADPELVATMDAVAEGKLDTYTGVERMLARLLRRP